MGFEWNGKQVTKEEWQKKVSDPKTIINKLKIEMLKDTKVRENDVEYSLADKKADYGEMVIEAYRQARSTTKNGHLKLELEKIGTCDDWTWICIWHAPNYYTGWRKVTSKVGRWLLGL